MTDGHETGAVSGLRRPARRATDAWDEVIDELVVGRRQPTIAFQAVVDLRRGTVVGYEALSRFPGPPDATPDVWFAEAGRRDAGAALEAAVLRSALRRRPELPPNCFLAMNITPRLLESAPVRSVMVDRDLRGVVLELTEHEPIEDYDALALALEPYRAAGAMIAVDDVGAGYSGLTHILALRPNILKLDRGLVTGVHGNEAKRALVEMIGTFANRIDSWVLAEGIEVPEELDTLIRLQVPLGQGYLLRRPEPTFTPLAPAIANRIRERSARNRQWRDTIGAAMEQATTLERAELEAGAADRVDRFLDGPVVLVDGGRPGGLVVQRFPSVQVVPMLVAGVLSRSHDVLQRAITRQAHDRFHPIAVCDNTGQLLGVATVERLIGQVLTRTEGADGADRAS